MDSDVAIQTHRLTRRFGDVVAVDHISFSIPRSRIYGFLGPNGSGKTTTIRMLCGLLQPSDGTAVVLGFSMPHEAEKLKLRAGYMTQRFSLYDDLSVRENLTFVARIYGIAGNDARYRIDQLLDEMNLRNNVEQMAGTMSGGQKQRLALAATTLHKPDILFLDEPTAGVDPQTRRDFWDDLFRLAERGTTILVSTHYMDEAERCHGLAILDSGKIVANASPRELIADLQASVLSVTTDRLVHVKELLDRENEVIGASQLGAQLRVLVKKDVPNPADFLKHRLEGENVEIAPIKPNLEDVFVVATKRPHRLNA